MSEHSTPEVGVIGAGQIGQCVVRGLVASGFPGAIVVSEPDETRRQQLDGLGGAVDVVWDNQAAAQADVVVLAVLPGTIPEVLAQIAPAVRERGGAIVSLAAAVSLAHMRGVLGPHVDLFAAMPNSPIRVGAGVTALCADDAASEAARERVEGVFERLGQAIWIADEALFGAVAAIAGCSPAYFYRVAEHLVAAGVETGLTEPQARDMATQAALGAAMLMVEGERSLGELVKEVATPGGVTEAALQVFERGGLGELVGEAVRTAEARARPGADGSFSAAQVAMYEEQGFVLSRRLSEAQATELKQEVLGLASEPSEQCFYEDDGQTLRSYNGAHLHSALVRRWASSPELLLPAQQLLGGDVYLYQTRLILKAPFGGGTWPWHQDFRYWMVEDGVREPRMLLATVFLDDVTPINSPLMVVPGSHQLGTIELKSRTGATKRGDYRANLGTDGEFVLDNVMMDELVGRMGCHQATGRAGSVLFFHPNIVHGSTENISPRARAMMYFVFNRTDNLPEEREFRRPDFLCSRDFTPLELEA